MVHGHGRGTRLGTCLVVKPCVSYVMSLQDVFIFHYVGGAQAWTRHAPWYMPCAAASVSRVPWPLLHAVNADKCSIMFLISLH